jgi:hypothetical protein
MTQMVYQAWLAYEMAPVRAVQYSRNVFAFQSAANPPQLSLLYCNH